MTNSKEFFTGFLNLTIDNAPTIPNESAILFDITFVTTKVIIGRRRHINVYWKLLDQVCFAMLRLNLINKPEIIQVVIDGRITYNNCSITFKN